MSEITVSACQYKPWIPRCYTVHVTGATVRQVNYALDLQPITPVANLVSRKFFGEPSTFFDVLTNDPDVFVRDLSDNLRALMTFGDAVERLEME